MNEERMAERHMKHTLNLAAGALELGELPIAAIVVLDDRIIGSATTSECQEGRLLVHAELAALDQADRLRLSLADRRSARLFTNLEPCLMCLGAAMSFFLGEVDYALESPADGAVDLVRAWVRATDDMPQYRFPKVEGGLLRAESIRLFAQYVSLHPPGPLREWAETLAQLDRNR